MTSSLLALPPHASFETVLEATQQFLHALEAQSLGDADIQAGVVHLLSLPAGPRGFFATLLTSDGPVAEAPPAALLAALGSHPETVADLLVKNLAMSTAMRVQHQRQGKTDLVQGSAQVQRRSQTLLLALKTVEIQQHLQDMLQPSQAYAAFLDRWGYDVPQKQAIATAVAQVLQTLNAQDDLP
ncbi:hypothetical protein [Lyngbya confervoides]|uniref:Uncharacterized protein n=1 Tax=Lyngbya confervoides BDU141951 TaxID=1574623 RepID=A0ABD4T2R4_9CYAN|nr:hypothetical protein [Lyngbya confervoides]MCM1982740.1 hypothetical protein [Lyngbya confervoides BDU141951]